MDTANVEQVSTEQVAATTTEQVEATTTTETNDQEGQDLGWSAEQKTYIESLRKENAKYRTRSKELETNYNDVNERFSKVEKGLRGLFGDEGDNDYTPEQQVEMLNSQNETLVLNNALTEAALEYGIGKEDYSYFKFLVQERLGSLEEGEELTEEELDGIANASRRGKTASSTSVDDGSPAPQTEGGVTLEGFKAMGINERSLLFSKNEALYKQLVSQERSAVKNK